MVDCGIMNQCSFFRVYGMDESKSLAIAGFVRIYCRGDRQAQCLRKKVSAALGGPDHVPPNILPNGLAMSGTKTDDWPEEAKEIRMKAASDTKG